MNTTVKKLKNQKHIALLVFLCAVIYFVSYVTRINYSAVLVEIMKSEGYTKAAASVPLTGLFIVYGIGQLISGYLGDKFSPEKIIFTGLIITALMNLALPFSPNTGFMTICWSINGFAQALMWPPLVKILAKFLSPDDYKLNIVYIIFGSSIGTIFVYAVSPIVISFANWKYVFFGAAAIAVAVAFIWISTIFRIESKAEDTENPYINVSVAKDGKKLSFTKSALILLSLIMIGNIFQGLLRDGISTWMPTYMSDTFGFNSSSAILTGVALPIATMIISKFTARLYRNVLKNEAKCTSLFFFICTICCSVLYFVSSNPALSTVMLMSANAVTHAINFTYTSISVAKFERFGKTSFVTGAINSSVYIGSALSTYGIAKITEICGWSGTMLTWLIASILGLVVCIFTIKPFSREL